MWRRKKQENKKDYQFRSERGVEEWQCNERGAEASSRFLFLVVVFHSSGVELNAQGMVC